MGQLHFAILLLLVSIVGLKAQDVSKDVKKAEKYFELRDFESSEKRFKKILEYQPEHDDALWRLGDIAWLRYDFEEAFTYYGIASGLSWKSDEHIRRYIEMLIMNGLFSQAKKWALNLKSKNQPLGGALLNKIEFAEKHINSPASYQVERHEMNSKHSDFGANFLAEDYLVFSSSRTDIKRVLKEKGQNNWAGQSFNQLFVGPAREAENLDQPLFLQTDLENNYNEGPLGISGDGDWVAVTKNNFLDAHNQIYTPGVEMSLYLGRLNDQGKWKDLQPFEHNVQGYASGMATLNETGDVMYFASNRPDGFGGFDLYVTEKTANGWSYPRNMGSAINTPGNEITPFISNNVLFFSSDMHPGLGGFDVYRTEIVNGEIPTKIYHLGTEVNTAYDESYFIFDHDNDLGFLSSNRNSGYAEDLFRVKGLGKRVQIKVLDAESNKGLYGAVIDMKSCDNQTLKTDSEGMVSVRIMKDVNCNIRITKDGYGLVEIPFNTSEREYWELALYRNEAADESEGMVFDINGAPVSRVYVKATDVKSGYFEESISSEDGKYSLNLEPKKFYKVEFLKSGFKPHHISLTTDEVLSPDLPTVNISPQTEQDIEASNDLPKIENNAPTHEGYALQIGAFKDLESVSLSNFSDIADLGTLFTINENGVFKLRLGVYDNEVIAEDILDILKKRGYKAAYKVYQGNNLDELVSVERTSDNGIKSNSGAFGVQLGAYSEPKWFDRSSAESLGYLATTLKQGLTVFYLYGIQTHEESQAILEKAKRIGFSDAFVIKFTGDGAFTKY